jgi:predicted TIM-barrel fold metal-dependent hydrolase
MLKTPISADSHITEPPNCYSDFIEARYKDTAPKMIQMEGVGDVFLIDGMDRPIPLGLLAAAGKDPKDIRVDGARFDDLWRGGWDPKARLEDQDKDGVAGEFIYPTVGMLLCNHDDFDYKKACMDAYNRWLQEFVGHAPDRLFGLAQAAMRSPEEGAKELSQIKEMGFRGVMMPGRPQQEDYDSEIYNPVWEAAVDLGLPLSFHILTSKTDALSAPNRGPAINGFQTIIRGNQDIIGTFIFSGVFDRYPDLKIVCVEADAGWAPHYMYRMDHAYKRHRFWMKAPPLDRLPSEYFRENVYMTFQDDFVAFKLRDLCNIRRLMWANDFPHSDSTWPWSQQVLDEQAKDLTDEERNAICHDNVTELYGLAS